MTWQSLVPLYGCGTAPVRKKRNNFFAPSFRLKGDLDRLFESLFDTYLDSSPATEKLEKEADFVPMINLENAEKEYRVSVEVPGSKKEDISLEFKENVLHISGEKKLDFEETKDNSQYIGRSYGKFMRSIPFEVEIDEESIDAEMKDGILSISLPKKEPVKEKITKLSIR